MPHAKISLHRVLRTKGRASDYHRGYSWLSRSQVLARAARFGLVFHNGRGIGTRSHLSLWSHGHARTNPRDPVDHDSFARFETGADDSFARDQRARFDR